MRYFSVNLHAESYIKTKAALRSTPPIISLSQCTPETSLQMTINTLNAEIIIQSKFLNDFFFIRDFSCIIVVGIIQSTSRVVDEG